MRERSHCRCEEPCRVSAVAVGAFPAVFRCHLSISPFSPVCAAVSPYWLLPPPTPCSAAISPPPPGLCTSIKLLPIRGLLPLSPPYLSSSTPPPPPTHTGTPSRHHNSSLRPLLPSFGQQTVDLSLPWVPTVAYQQQRPRGSTHTSRFLAGAPWPAPLSANCFSSVTSPAVIDSLRLGPR